MFWLFHGNHNCSQFNVSELELFKIWVKVYLFFMKLDTLGQNCKKEGWLSWLSLLTGRSGKLKIKQGIIENYYFVELKNINIFCFWGKVKGIVFSLFLPLSTTEDPAH